MRICRQYTLSYRLNFQKWNKNSLKNKAWSQQRKKNNKNLKKKLNSYDFSLETSAKKWTQCKVNMNSNWMISNNDSLQLKLKKMNLRTKYKVLSLISQKIKNCSCEKLNQNLNSNLSLKTQQKKWNKRWVSFLSKEIKR